MVCDYPEAYEGQPCSGFLLQDEKAHPGMLERSSTVLQERLLFHWTFCKLELMMQQFTKNIRMQPITQSFG